MPPNDRLPMSQRARDSRDAPISWLMAQAMQVEGMVSLAAGFVDQQTLPHAELSALAAELLGDPAAGRRALQYGTTVGDPALRARILEMMRAGSDAPVYGSLTPDDVIVTTGSQQFLYLLGEVLLDPGDIVLTEDPSYFVFVGALRNFSVRPWGVAVDAAGVIPGALDEALGEIHAAGSLSRVKLVYLMTYCQNPMGVSLSAARRRDVWACIRRWREKGMRALLIEDAAYRDLRFSDDPLPPLFEQQESNEMIAYTKSFSKCLSPGLRLGFGVAPRWVRDLVVRFKSSHDFGTSNLCQQLVLRVIESGLFDRHVTMLRERYRAKKTLLESALRARLPRDVEIVEPDGGMYLWATLPEGCETGKQSQLFAAAMDEKILYVPGEMCAVPCGPQGEIRAVNRRSLRLCYAFPDDGTVKEGAARLARAVCRVL